MSLYPYNFIICLGGMECYTKKISNSNFQMAHTLCPNQVRQTMKHGHKYRIWVWHDAYMGTQLFLKK